MARHVPMPIPRELDLRRSTHASTSSATNATLTTANIVVDRMNAVPGFLASAGEFLFLRISIPFAGNV
jgi:hypothetical protein